MNNQFAPSSQVAAASQLSSITNSGSVPSSMQHLTNGTPLAFSDDGINSAQWQLNTRFGYSQAIVWQIKFIISSFLTKKMAGAASAELSQLSEKFGADFDKYLIRELVEQIDLKDPNKVSKDKNEAVKSQLLAQELSRMCLKPVFLKYFNEIAQGVFGDRYGDFLSELSRRLKLSSKMQLLIALSLAETCPVPSQYECYSILKQKLVEYMQGQRQEALEDYAVHRLNYILSVYPEFSEDNPEVENPPNFFNAVAQFRAQNAKKQQQTSSLALRVNLGGGDLMSQNPSAEDPSFALIKTGSDFDTLSRASRFMQPWEVLQDLGYYSTFDYQVLTMALQDFKDINERTMAHTILRLALNNSGEESAATKIAFNAFKSNKTGDPLKKEGIDKTQTLQWQADPNHFSRAFRENYSNLNWLKVFESFGELDEEIGVDLPSRLDQRAYETLIQIFNKSKPPNLQIPSSLLLEREWASPAFQYVMGVNAIRCYISADDRSFNFGRNPRKLAGLPMADIPVPGDATQAFLDVWTSPEILEFLFKLSNRGLYREVRTLMNDPISRIPDYLVLTMSKCNFEHGACSLLDDTLSTLMPIFLINQSSIAVLKKLWELNQGMMIRAICECCRHEQRVLNLSRVLDITQEIKDSLIKIVYCDDFDFAVNLGILAGKREFLHYDVWLKERIKKVGTPFVKAFIKYINEQIIIPCREFMLQGGYAVKQLTPEDNEAIERARDTILERSHLSKERLCMTMEHLENPANFQSLVQSPTQFELHPYFPPEAQGVLVKISYDVQYQIKDLVAQYTILFPRQVGPTQSTEEIDKAANEYFQHIFSAEPHQVDERIQELIQTLQAFQKSQVVKEQEIYACVLHGLFDEYRFLHKYPHVYLTKIAKLFGAIIKNRLLNNVLQGIALKFVIEAFRRDGKRLMFGIIVVKEFAECLPDFPKQFQEIYQNRDKIQQKDPELYQRIELLYKQTQRDLEPETEAGSSHEEADSGHNTSGISFTELEEGKSIGTDEMAFPNFDQAHKAKEMSAAEAAKKEASKGGNKLEQTTSEFTPSDGGAALGAGQNQGNLFKQMGTTSSTFVPSNQANAAGKSNLKVNQKQAPNRKISPQVTAQPQFGQQATPTLSNVNPQNRAANDKKAQNQASGGRPDSADPFAANPLGTNLNVGSAAFGGANAQANAVQDQKDPRRGQQAQQPALPGRADSKPMYGQIPPQVLPQGAQVQQQPMGAQHMPINIKAKSFRPSDFNPALLGGLHAMQQQMHAPNPRHIAWQKMIDQKIEEAKANKQHRLRFEDLIEDLSLEQPAQNVIDQIKLKCNNTGKNNFKQNLEAIKELVITKAEEQRAARQAQEGEPEPSEERKDQKDINLTWFINYILTKRISGQNQTLYHIYIELIRNIGHPDAITRTIHIASEIFSRCLLIDEAEFNKVANKVGGTSGMISQIKQYLKTLGQFLGQLTLGRNRPVRSDELDIKQLLIQGFQHENRRLIISFACNIIKEGTKGLIFTKNNPWLSGILQILREMVDCLQLPGMKVLKDKEEIESELVFLFKSFNIQNINEIIPSGALKASQGSQFVSVSQEIELSFLHSKASIIPVRQKTSTAGSQAPGGPDGEAGSTQKTQQDVEWENFAATLPSMSEERLENFKFIFTNVALQEDKRTFLKSKFLLDDRTITDSLTKAVEESIEEILKPVVDRSVTIALITTKELVLKDFAHDGDGDRVAEASEHIIQSLAGSLALVTCREPLRLQMNNFLLKALKQTCFNAGSTTGIRRASLHEGMSIEEQERMTQQEQYLNYYMQDHEDALIEMAQETSKDNLELGCKMIKNAVITKAQTQVREDRVLNLALEQRQKAKEMGETLFHDRVHDSRASVRVNDLPAPLRPSASGLTEDQFRVYKDFSKLSYKSKFDSVGLKDGEGAEGDGSENGAQQPSQGHPKQPPPAKYDFSMEAILARLVEERPLDSATRSLMTIKLEQLKKLGQTQDTSQDRTALWNFCDSQFQTFVQFCDSRQWKQARTAVEKIRLVVLGLPGERFGSRLLREAFLEMEEMYILNADMNVLLLQSQVFPVLEWDNAIAFYIQNCSGHLQSKAFEFLSDVVKKCLYSAKLFTHELIPEIVKLLSHVTAKNDQHSEMLKFYVGDVFEQLKAQIPSEFENRLREYFKKWVELSQIDDPVAQERKINHFFEELSQQGIAKDEELLFVFCKIMVKESIELAQHTKLGERRLNNNTLDYRFIDSFIKLVICLLTATSELNKMQFMSKIFEFIRQKLDDDHFTQQRVFNQKPYYRILMNILRAVTMSESFYAKMKRKILYDLADLLQDLNPNNYPAFAFAWLALISNQLFMPNFIKITPSLAQFNQHVMDSQSQLAKKGNQSSLQQSNLNEIENQLQRLYKMKDLLVCCFTFIKFNFIPGQQASPAMRSFYTATMNVILVILKDYPQFLCDFHFNFVNSLPDHAIQLKNLILTAFPKHIHPPSPFSQGLKVDPMQDQQDPRILSNFGDYIKLNSLKDHLNQYFATGNQIMINEICLKMMSSKEKLNGKVVPQSTVINAVVLYIATKVMEEKAKNPENSQVIERESDELFKQITLMLNDETRLCFLNSIVNELRYPNSHTFFFCIILLRLFDESKPNIQEQISTIFFERLQTLRPYPWGLMINFRELIQNQKYGFTKSAFITQNQEAVKTLLANKERLRPYLQFMPLKQHPTMPNMIPQVGGYPNVAGSIGSMQFTQQFAAAQPGQQIGGQPQFMRAPSGSFDQIQNMQFQQQQQQKQQPQQPQSQPQQIPKFQGLGDKKSPF